MNSNPKKGDEDTLAPPVIHSSNGIVKVLCFELNVSLLGIQVINWEMLGNLLKRKR